MQLASIPESASRMVESLLRRGAEAPGQTRWLASLDERLTGFNERLEQVIRGAQEVIAAADGIKLSELEVFLPPIRELAAGTHENLRDLRSDMEHWSELLRFYSPEDQRSFWSMIRHHEEKLVLAVETVDAVLCALERRRQDATWREAVGSLLELDQLPQILGEESGHEAQELARQQRLLALSTSDGRQLFPVSQFDAWGRPFPEIKAILGIFSGVVSTPYTIASWMVSPQDLLEGETPADWLRAGRDPAALLEAARRSASKLAH